MIAERFLPRLFDQVAILSAVSSDGKCAEIAELETILKDESQTKSKTIEKSTPDKEIKVIESVPKISAPESDYLNEWRTSKEILDWAKINPPLANIDLRPYIFVSKDKKDYFGISSSLGHLASLAEKLFGQKLSVQALNPELKKISPQEARQLFDAIRGRLIGASTFENEPAGIFGLIALVKLHSILQPDLLDFLEGLPKDKTGPWVLKGWEGAIVEQAHQDRFKKLINYWAKESNSVLRAAASNVLKMKPNH